MQSKNKPPMTVTERLHVGTLKALPCVVCGAEGPSDAHEFEQGLWFAAVPLCRLCHMQPDGWHGTRERWTLRKMDAFKAINETIRMLTPGSKPVRTSLARPSKVVPRRMG